MKIRTAIALSAVAAAIVAAVLAPPVRSQFSSTLPPMPPLTVIANPGPIAAQPSAIPYSQLFAGIFGAPTATPHGILIGEGNSPLNFVTMGDAQLLIGQTGTDPAPKSVSGDVALTDTGVITIGAGAVTGAKIATGAIVGSNISTNAVANSNLSQMAANTVKANITGATANAADVPLSSLGMSGLNLAARIGSMDVWQRGAGGAASIAVAASTTAYTADGCYLATGANQASTVNAVAGIATGSFKAAAITRNGAQTGTTAMQFGCPLDSDEIALFAGQFVTFSFTASTGANWSPTSGTITYNLFCGTGTPKKQTTGYTGQTTPISTSVNIAAGTAAARYQSTSAAIVPANCTQAEIAWLWTPVGTAGAADTVTIDDVQLEIVLNAASLATPYQRQDFDFQLNKAQRHFAKTFTYGTAPAQAAGRVGVLQMLMPVTATVDAYFQWNFPRQMRVNPTVVAYNPDTATSNCRDITSGADLASTVNGAATESVDRVFVTCAAGGSVNDALGIHLSADAGI